ncbi:hypothetical protein [Paenibacillus hamazuiensis]|uniref:hypothetical protein n=1 Tax=Paenibacillus hamazuiensis TaxID=2936508 RepID=UPI00200C509B|nr:hypothetical protein [Paenibacillus hamazuiensis]
MKRYWFSFLFVPLILAGVGSYYIQAAANPLPEFVLQRQSGDSGITSNVVLQGNFGNNPEFTESVSIDAQGSEYRRDTTLFGKLTRSWYVPEMRKLVKDYPGFMRGKLNVRSLYEDEKRLAYVDVNSEGPADSPDYTFDVSVLDKSTKQTVTYKTAVPGGKQYRVLIVHDVQAADENLKVLTANYAAHGEPELHLYTLGLQSGKEPTDQLLTYDVPVPSESEASLQTNYMSDDVKPSPYSLLYVSLSKTVKSGGSYVSEETGGRLLVFNITNGQEVKINSKEIDDLLSGGRSNYMDMMLAGEWLTLVKRTDEGIRTVRYNIKSGQSSGQLFSPVTNPWTIAVKDHFMYVVTGSKPKGDSAPLLTVVDLASGNTVYQGIVGLRENDRHSAEIVNNLNVYGLTFQ